MFVRERKEGRLHFPLLLPFSLLTARKGKNLVFYGEKGQAPKIMSSKRVWPCNEKRRGRRGTQKKGNYDELDRSASGPFKNVKRNLILRHEKRKNRPVVIRNLRLQGLKEAGHCRA